MIKTYIQFTKFGIVIFVLLSGLAGYALGYQSEVPFDWFHLLKTMAGLYFLSSGSLALNQAQEWKLDQKMKRTATRPVASGKIKPLTAYIMAACFLLLGVDFLMRASGLAAFFGILTVILYNGIYTYYLKPKWIYAAVPGAVPGSLPVTIGYAAINPNVFSSDSIYLFLILFLWQMPHFWALAIKFKDDYSDGGVPTLPVALGLEKTFFQMGMYTFCYVGTAIASPFFVTASWFYLLLVVPMSVKVLIDYYRFKKDRGQKRWLSYFMWINLSVLVYLFVPAIDKWNFIFTNTN
ncbi:MAG: protoheme IX farnesyltransferase [Bdellovibrionota bacterium]